ncbi:hypothetical protein NDU88_005631 [Pleurodeles waltl]|uniref:Uncharacterized protein n=1 Tax=Pleurodeles waltl TaxID=8319 RepID=A0AAV7TVC4_PLEWA|nr:hypothetical protein NDU88_005631 [Pleurodeles waltl]
MFFLSINGDSHLHQLQQSVFDVPFGHSRAKGQEGLALVNGFPGVVSHDADLMALMVIEAMDAIGGQELLDLDMTQETGDE